MKRCVAVVALVMSLTLPVLAQEPSAQLAGTAPDQQVVEIHAVLTEVRDALVRVQKKLREKVGTYPALATITLTLQTVITKDKEAQFKLWVISLGSTVEKENTQEMVIQLTPPSHLDPSAAGTTSLTEALEHTIVSAVDGARDAGSPEFPLNFTGLSASIGFTVKKTGKVGGSIQVSPITAELSGSLAKTVVQNIKVVFGKIE
jgi:hypothetical protein